ncbi:MAG: alpha-glucan family phosphorylase [Candidatus Kerfeldbacteria bacterium]|nr:alpha-glucan family phosphorylase [Candidatus Kerfeldbacteria bacterium]
MNLRKFRSTLGEHPLAYMSAEFAVDERLPIYAGGLGVLAGDIVRQANTQELPFVAVGLFYKQGYFKQRLTLTGEQKEDYPLLNISDAPIELVATMQGDPLLVSIPVAQGEIFFQIWEYLEGDVSVYLLDTDVPQNTPEHRLITRRLYGNDRANRLLQEIVLGIGGVRALMALHIHPSIFHLNESHSALAIFEITYHYMNEYGMSFYDAYNYGRQKIVFTNHTLIPGGNEVFTCTQVTDQLSTYAKQLGLPMNDMLAQGTVAGSPNDFSLTRLALNMACHTNTVSQYHSTMAKQMWPDVTMPAITNGVHLATWVNADIKAQAPYFDTKAITDMPEHELWRVHDMAKHRLIDEIQYRTGKHLQQDHIIITWARRFAAYKRPTMLFSDMKRLQRLVTQTARPVQIVLAGKAHPNDATMHQAIVHINQLIKQFQLQDQVVFVPNYSLALADVLVSGSDVWLNTPIRGQEASGTSGMKAGANGVLQCSVSDGWVVEAKLTGIGWEIPDDGAGELYDILEQQVVPLYYQRNNQGISSDWVQRMKATMKLVWTKFSARRMLEEYIDILYRPALELERKEKHEHNWRRNYRTRHIV